MRKTIIWFYGTHVDARYPAVITELLGGKFIKDVPTAEDVDYGNPLAPESVLVVHAPIDEDTIEKLHTGGIIAPGDCHFVRMASFDATRTASMMTSAQSNEIKSVHGRQMSTLENYMQLRHYKPRLIVTNDVPEEQISNLLVALKLDSKVV